MITQSCTEFHSVFIYKYSVMTSGSICHISRSFKSSGTIHCFLVPLICGVIRLEYDENMRKKHIKKPSIWDVYDLLPWWFKQSLCPVSRRWMIQTIVGMG